MKRMRRRLSMAVAVFGLIAAATAQARADQVFDLSFSGSGVSGNALLDATPNGDGSFTAISSTGTITGAPNGVSDLNTLLPNPNAPGVYVPPANPSLYYDNQLFPGQNPPIDINGLSWISNGVSIVAYAYAPNAGGYLDSGGTVLALSSITLTSVPEPSTLLLGSLGVLMGLGFAWRRRRKAPAA